MAWVNAIIQGVLTGGLYALVACGLSLMFGVMKVVNLAHGDLAVVAGYVAIGVITVTHIPVLWSFCTNTVRLMLGSPSISSNSWLAVTDHCVPYFKSVPANTLPKGSPSGVMS